MAVPVVKIRGVSKSFGPKLVLNNISLDINEGEIFGIIGQSGAGKTTLLECLVGFLNINQGEIEYKSDDNVYNYVSIKKHAKELNKNIGFAMQHPSFYDKLTIKENLEYFATLYNIPKQFIEARIKKLLDLVELTGDENTVAENLSGGMQKRLDIACSMINDPKILILDEPTADLDPVLRKHIWDLIRRINSLGKTIIVSSHFLEEMDALCSRIAIIANQTIAHVGTTEDLRRLYPYTSEILVCTATQDYQNLASRLKGLPIAKIGVRGNKMVIYARDSELVLRQLVKLLDERKEKILELEVQRPSLDDVFAAIVQHKVQA
jgi:ABC-2 type transport system ATP-binding protein